MPLVYISLWAGVLRMTDMQSSLCDLLTFNTSFHSDDTEPWAIVLSPLFWFTAIAVAWDTHCLKCSFLLIHNCLLKKSYIFLPKSLLLYAISEEEFVSWFQLLLPPYTSQQGTVDQWSKDQGCSLVVENTQRFNFEHYINQVWWYTPVLHVLRE